MGVDASYLYGYGAELSELEWDFEYLKEKYKDKMNESVDVRYSWKPTWSQFISELEKAVEDEDTSLIAEYLEDIGNLLDVNYDDEVYVTVNHNHLSETFPNARLCEIEDFAKLYYKQLGIKNLEVIKWIEWGFFS